jgi:hypothetical protein
VSFTPLLGFESRSRLTAMMMISRSRRLLL